ncbi:MAG: 2-oxoacid:acceptor oxidoreductase family protein [Pseudolabrys sp.]
MARTSISIVFAGSGGAGALTAGSVLLRAAAHAGYYGMMTQLLGPQVRGGESAALLQVSTEPVESQPDRYELFVALDWEKVEQFGLEIPLDETTVIIADPEAGPVPPGIARSKARVVPFVMSDKLASQHERALRGMRVNMFAAGAAATLLGLAPEDIRTAVDAVFAGKSAELAAANANSALAGAEAAGSLPLNMRLPPPQKTARWLISGNQAVALGALRGGVRFVGCYPITLATDMVEWLSPRLEKLGGKLVLAEDELASINMALGASYGGTPSMTFTSGPGLSLMVETLGLAVATEIPLVVVDVMRGGPSTGLPSKTEQGDVNLAIHGAHGDAPRVVLAPMSVSDCINTAEFAVYAAESLQVPVLVLSDKALGQARTVVDPHTERPKLLTRRTDGAPADKPFKRYALGANAVAPMPVPGTPGHQWVAEGLTHNEADLPASGAGIHVAQINRRGKKIARFDAGEYWGKRWGLGDTAVIAFGSTVGPGARSRAAARRRQPPHPRRRLAHALAGAGGSAGARARWSPPRHRRRAEPQCAAVPLPARAEGHTHQRRKRRAPGPLAVPALGDRELCGVNFSVIPGRREAPGSRLRRAPE